MLKRIYIDNYKSLVNFEMQFDNISLFVGENGSGKSTVFQVLRKLQDFINGYHLVTALFHADSLTRWQNSSLQTFEMDIEQRAGICRYELAIEHDKMSAKARVKHERLSLNGSPLLRFELGEVQLYRDDSSAGATFSYDWSRSVLPSIPTRRDNTHLSQFKTWVNDHLIITHPIPLVMDEGSSGGVQQPSARMENFVAWYDHLRDDGAFQMALSEELKAVLPGFSHINMDKVGEERRVLRVNFFKAEGKDTIGYKFSELSDGQRMLIVLYTLLHATKPRDEQKYLLCIDEPENFVALPEIQPWLRMLYDRCVEEELQAVVISQHPEFINYLLATPNGYWFERGNNQPTRIRGIQFEDQDGVSIAELVERNWIPTNG